MPIHTTPARPSETYAYLTQVAPALLRPYLKELMLQSLTPATAAVAPTASVQRRTRHT